MNRTDVEKRFWSKVDTSFVPGECWEWDGTKDECGYGKFLLLGKKVQAHRLAWKLTRYFLPDYLCVCHECDNPSCCNPSHLFLGTQNDNMQDKMRKGRHVKRSGTGKSKVGEQHWKSKLLEKDVVEIRRLFALGGVTKTELGQRNGVHRSTITTPLV